MEKAELIRSSFFIKRDAMNSLCVGGNQNRVSGAVEITGVYKSDSVHSLQ